MRRIHAPISLVLSFSVLGACTQWGTQPVYGPRQEVERRMLGEPSLATTTSSTAEAGFSGFSTQHVATAGLSAESGSITRTHCVQEAEIHYVQPYDLEPVPEGRAKDVLGGIVLGLVGMSVMLVAHERSQTIFKPGDPLYEEPPSQTPGLLLGGALLAGGAAWIGYSFGSLPKARKPAVEHAQRAWTETQLVEATGCTQPPAAPVATNR